MGINKPNSPYPSPGADHVDPGDEAGVRIVGPGTYVGEIEMGVRVDMGGHDDAAGSIDAVGPVGCWVCAEIVERADGKYAV